MNLQVVSRSRLVRLAGGHVGWIGLLEYLEPIIRGVVVAHCGPGAVNAAGDGSLQVDEGALEQVIGPLERRLGVVLDHAERIGLRSCDDLAFAFAHALAREAVVPAGAFRVRVRVTDGDGWVEYDERLTPYIAQHLHAVVAHEAQGGGAVELSIPSDEGLWAWVALGRALRAYRRMIPPPARQSDMTARFRPPR